MTINPTRFVKTNRIRDLAAEYPIMLLKIKGGFVSFCLTFFAFVGEYHYVVENTSRQF